MALVDFGVLGTLNIPDQYVDHAQIELARLFGPYAPTIPDGQGGVMANPETPAQFINREMKLRMIEGVKRAIKREAAEAAEAAVDISLVVIDDV